MDSVIKQKGEKEVKDMLKVDILREKAATAGIKVSDKELKKLMMNIKLKNLKFAQAIF